MSTPVEKIKEILSVEDVVGSYVKLDRAGKNLRARCPFHNEKTPSFFVSPDRGVYHCFGCGKGGDIFSFVEEFEGLDFSGALKVLAQKAGVELKPVDPRVEDARQRRFELIKKASSYFQDHLKEHKGAQEYLKNRKIEDKTSQLFSLGYAPDDWRNLHKKFTDEGYTEDELEDVGLIKKSESGKHYDTFRSRIMFPISDSAGRTIAFSGRLYEDGGKEKKEKDVAPKYLNSPETPLFNKSQTLYAFEKAKGSIRKYDFAIVAEGQIDVVLAHQSGYTNTVAPLGTALTGNHLSKIHKLTRNIVFAFDADTAGLASFQKSAALALAMDFDVKAVRLPAGEDPADVISRDPDEWKKLVKEAKHTVDFLVETFRDEEKDDRAFKQRVSREVIPFIARISNSIDQAHFVGRIASVLSVPEDVIYDEVRKVPKSEEVSEKPNIQPAVYNRREKALQRIVGVLEWQEGSKESLIDTKQIRAKLSTLMSDADIKAVAGQEYAFEAEMLFSDTEGLNRYLEDLFLVLEEDNLREELESSLAELKEAEQAGDESRTGDLMSVCQELARKIEKIKHKLQNTE